MKYIVDHDFHIHSTISPCCHDENQTPETILKYAKENNFKAVCLTNHLWDENVKSVGVWHPEQRFDYITKVLPLPQDENVKFLFGAEAEMEYNFTLGISNEHLDCFDFITVSTTHLHLEGYTVKKRPQKPEEAAELWLTRFEELLKKDLPWHKMGVSHLTGTHVFKADHAKAVSLLKTDDLYNIFSECAKKGKGVFLFGAKPGVAETAGQKLCEKVPGLIISGTRDGYFKPEDTDDIINQINESGAAVLWVCLGAPKQENWMAENKDKLKVGVMLGLGGSLDVYAGNVKRAPKWMIKMKLEWLYRLIKEPWRFSRMIKIPGVLVIARREKKRRKKNG